MTASRSRGAALLLVLVLVLALLVLAGLVISYASGSVRSAGDDRREKESLLCAEEGLRRGAQWVGTTKNEEQWKAAFVTEAEVQADLTASALVKPQINCTRCLGSGVSDQTPTPRVYVYLLDNEDGDGDRLDDNDLHAVVRSYCVAAGLIQGGRARMVEALVDNTQGGTRYAGQQGGTGRTGQVDVQ